MSVCQIEERDAGRPYPRTCPTCRLSNACAKGLDRKSQSARIAELEAEVERLKIEIGECKLVIEQQDRDAEALSRTGAVKVRELLDEGLEILNGIIDNVKRRGNYSPESTCVFIDQAGQCLREALSALEAQLAERAGGVRFVGNIPGSSSASGFAPLTAEPAAPEGRQDDEPRAYIVHAPEDDYYGTGPDSLQFHPLAQRDLDNGYRQTPLYGRPSEQAVTEAMVARASAEYQVIFGKYLLSSHARRILKAAMEAHHD